MNIIKIEQLQIIFTAIIALSVISPPLANLFELILIISLFFCRTVFVQSNIYFQTIDFKIHASFGALLLLGILYQLVDTQTYLSSILNWRKFLLLPIGFILFQNHKIQKDKALKIVYYAIFGLTIINLIYKSNILNFFKPGIIAYQIGTTSSEGMFVAVALSIILSSVLNNTNASMTEKILKYSAAAYFIFYIILFTTGRSGYLAMLIVLAFMLMKFIASHTSRKQIMSVVLLVSGVLLAITLLMKSETSSNRIKQAIVEFQQSEKNANENVVTSIGQRVIFWKNTLQMVPEYFLVGAGTGSFKAAYAKQVSDKSGLEGAVTQDPHNQYLKILIEQGILGLVVFIAILFRSLFQKKFKEEHYMLGASVICVWMVTSSFNAHFSTFMEGTFIWGWLGLFSNYSVNR
jgi:O-antigen ligase